MLSIIHHWGLTTGYRLTNMGLSTPFQIRLTLAFYWLLGDVALLTTAAEQKKIQRLATHKIQNFILAHYVVK